MTQPLKQKGVGKSGNYQLSFFQLDDPVLGQVRDEIINLDVNNLTPIEALNKLKEIVIIKAGMYISLYAPAFIIYCRINPL